MQWCCAKLCARLWERRGRHTTLQNTGPWKYWLILNQSVAQQSLGTTGLGEKNQRTHLCVCGITSPSSSLMYSVWYYKKLIFLFTKPTMAAPYYYPWSCWHWLTTSLGFPWVSLHKLIYDSSVTGSHCLHLGATVAQWLREVALLPGWFTKWSTYLEFYLTLFTVASYSHTHSLIMAQLQGW